MEVTISTPAGLQPYSCTAVPVRLYGSTAHSTQHTAVDTLDTASTQHTAHSSRSRTAAHQHIPRVAAVSVAGMHAGWEPSIHGGGGSGCAGLA
jgi:hypothetical protein